MTHAASFSEVIVDLPPDALAIARRLSHRPDLALLLDTSRATPAYVACDAIDTVYALDPEPTLELSPTSPAPFPRWIGVLPYEAGRGVERSLAQDQRALPQVHRPEWQRYGAVVEVTDRVRILGENADSVAHLWSCLLAGSERATTSVRLLRQDPAEAREVHLARIASTLEHIRRGDVYQVNLARRLSFALEGSPSDILARLLERTDGPFCAAITLSEVDVVVASPELFLSLDPHGALKSTPIKGTRPRGHSPDEDAALARDLHSDPKEHAELVMVVDVVRNDLGRVAVTGTVDVEGGFRIETFRSVHHRALGVRAQLSPRVTRTQLFEALLPSGSVTGAPKARAMEIIATTEAHRRGLYTGAFGMIQQDGGVRLGMAIRTLTRSRPSLEAHYFSGGGIVADSIPAQEVDETDWKAAHLSALFA